MGCYCWRFDLPSDCSKYLRISPIVKLHLGRAGDVRVVQFQMVDWVVRVGLTVRLGVRAV